MAAAATSSSWSMEDFCNAQIPADLNSLHEASGNFLNALLQGAGQQNGLSLIHPFCNSNSNVRWNNVDNAVDGVPPQQGPLRNQDHLETMWDVVLTAFYRSAPPLMAMGELWLRLFASVIAPLGIAYLVTDWIMTTTTNATTKASAVVENKRENWILSITCLLTVASSVVVLTDTFYILEFGHELGLTLLIGSLVVSVRTAWKHGLKSVWAGKVCLILLLLFLVYDYESGQLHFGGHPERDDQKVAIDAGFYFDTSSRMANSIMNHYAKVSLVPNYDERGVYTPWMPTGDSRTGLPFLLNKDIPVPTFTRLWLPVKDHIDLKIDTDDAIVNNFDEVIALDILFPPTGHDPHSKVVYLLLHGLNGGSQEKYVQEFALRRTQQQNATIIVMIARGLMNLPVRGWNLFHGARWTDVHQAAVAIKSGLSFAAAATATETPTAPPLLAGVGYSMGGIILTNYASRAGPHCQIDVGVGISGGLDMRFEKTFYRAQRLWQPILAQELREKFVLGKFGDRVRARLTKPEMKELMRAYHITDIDQTAIVAYNRFRDLDHYYSEMSALGDIPLSEYDQATTDVGSIQALSIPFCVIHSLDDPLITWRTVAANEGVMHPGNLTKLGNGNLFLHLTKRGGHVGWPLGWWPSSDKWKWMSDASYSFIIAVQEAREAAAVAELLSKEDSEEHEMKETE